MQPYKKNTLCLEGPLCKSDWVAIVTVFLIMAFTLIIFEIRKLRILKIKKVVKNLIVVSWFERVSDVYFFF